MIRPLSVIAALVLTSATFLLATSAVAQSGALAKPNSQQFGIREDGITSPAMRTAIERLHQAGVVPGRRGSLTFYRWTSATPPKLAHLGLWGEAIDDELFALTESLADLEHISIYETSITDDGMAVLAKFPKLRSLAVSPISRYEKKPYDAPQWSYPFIAERTNRAHITVQGLESIRAVATIESLSLIDAQLSAGDLAILRSWPKLGSVELSTVIDSVAVEHLAACPRLTSLTLGYREISAAEIFSLAKWAKLRKLKLMHAKLPQETLQALAQIASLEQLDLEECSLTDEDLAQLQLPAKCTTLGLKRNEIEGPGMKHLAKFQLKDLGLEFNNLTNDSLPHLSQLSSLESLALSYCREVNDQGIQSGVLQKMKHLKHLGLRGLKQVTDASLPKLTQFGHLTQITIRETGITLDGVAKMKEAMPETVVFK